MLETQNRTAFLATVRAVAFWQGNASTHPESRSTITKIYSNLTESRGWVKTIWRYSEDPEIPRFLVMSHLYSFSRICCWQFTHYLRITSILFLKFSHQSWFKSVTNLSTAGWIVSWRNLETIHPFEIIWCHQVVFLRALEIEWKGKPDFSHSFFLKLGAKY